MKKIILYGSRYGSSRRYAEQLSALSGIPTASFADAHALSDAKILVYVGGLYAGGVLGMKKVLRAHAPAPDQRLIVATVGLADPSLAENVQTSRIIAKATVSRMVCQSIPVSSAGRDRLSEALAGPSGGHGSAVPVPAQNSP